MFPDQPPPLWTVGRNGRQISCSCRLTPRGIELRLERDGEFLLSRRYADGDALLEAANDVRAEYESRGWTLL